MADNVAITAGAGTTIATDDASGVHFQKVKLIDGTADSSAAIPGDATNGLFVNARGPAAHDAAAAGNPLLLGAEALSAERAAVATTDVTKLVADLVGKLIVLPYANPENMVSGTTAVVTDTTRTSIIAAQGAGVRLYITSLIVTNGDATVGTFVKIEDDTTVILQGYAAAAGGGFALTFPTPLRLTANKALQFECVTTSAEVTVTAVGYKGV